MRKRSELKVNIIILNYNGRELLEECLPSVIEAAHKSSYKAEVTVIDNASADASREFLSRHYPGIKLIALTDNKVLCSFNAVLEKGSEDISILLNNDFKVSPDFIDPLIEVFYQREDAFVSVPKIMSFDGSVCENGPGETVLKYGLFWSKSRYAGYEKDVDRPALISHAANGAFVRSRFLSLGGFDSLYLPGIMEDADLCYRAYKTGLKCYYQPGSVVFHRGRASFRKVMRARKIEELAHRNTFLFMWKNMHSPALLLQHVIFLPLWLLSGLFKGRWEICTGFLRAICKIGKALAHRQAKTAAMLSDEEVFSLFARSRTNG